METVNERGDGPGHVARFRVFSASIASTLGLLIVRPVLQKSAAVAPQPEPTQQQQQQPAVRTGGEHAPEDLGSPAVHGCHLPSKLSHEASAESHRIVDFIHLSHATGRVIIGSLVVILLGEDLRAIFHDKSCWLSTTGLWVNLLGCFRLSAAVLDFCTRWKHST
jgi:hypothetical protein